MLALHSAVENGDWLDGVRALHCPFEDCESFTFRGQKGMLQHWRKRHQGKFIDGMPVTRSLEAILRGIKIRDGVVVSQNCKDSALIRVLISGNKRPETLSRSFLEPLFVQRAHAVKPQPETNAEKSANV